MRQLDGQFPQQDQRTNKECSLERLCSVMIHDYSTLLVGAFGITVPICSYKYCRWPETLNHHNKIGQTLCMLHTLPCPVILPIYHVPESLGGSKPSRFAPGDYPLLQKHFQDFNEFVSDAKAKSWKTLVHCQVEPGGHDEKMLSCWEDFD